MTNSARRKAAAALHEYMKARAVHEGVQYALTEEFFLQNLKAGVRFFFKVGINTNGDMYRDDECPDFFRQWKQSIN